MCTKYRISKYDSYLYIHSLRKRTLEAAEEKKTRYSNRLCKSLLDPIPYNHQPICVYNPETSKNSFRQKPRAEKQCLR